MSVSRRDFLRGGAALVLPLIARSAVAQGGVPPRPADTTKAGADALLDPTRLGRATAPVGPLDNDPGVIAIERRLRCICGCTLDVYTCRTTDFTCTYSPDMHQEVVARTQAKETSQQIVAAFVAEHGQTVLMAPPASGFNLAGYLVPGLSIAAVGVALAAYLSRRRTEPVVVMAGSMPAPTEMPDAAQAERLRRALDEVES